MAEASLGRSEAFAVAGVVAICLPIDDLEDGEWNRKTVSSAAEALGLGAGQALALAPMLRGERRKLRAAARAAAGGDAADEAAEEAAAAAEDREALAALAPCSRRGRRASAPCACSAASSCARATTRACAPRSSASPRRSACRGRASRARARSRARSPRAPGRCAATRRPARKWRWAKVGAATLGAGAALALTGGIAAPLLAVALTSTGTTIGATAAGFASASAVALVFGGVGGGLAGCGGAIPPARAAASPWFRSLIWAARARALRCVPLVRAQVQDDAPHGRRSRV